MGYQLVAITTDRPSNAEKTVIDKELSIKVLSDSAMTAAKGFGIAWRVDDRMFKMYHGYGIDLEEASGLDHHILPVPGVFIVSPDGMIWFKYVNPNHMIRLNREVLLTAAKAMMGRIKQKFPTKE